MIGRLVFRLFPYLLVLGAGLIVLAMLPVILRGSETEPTAMALGDVTSTTKARWLKVSGGGLYLPDAIVDESIKKATGERKVKAWFVPLVTEDEAIAMASARVKQTTRPSVQRLVLVKFSPDDFLRSYPTPEKLQPHEVFRPQTIQGLRANNVLFPGRLKDYIRAELQLPVEGVVVIDHGREPVQRDGAIATALVMVSVMALGVMWIYLRWRRRPTPPPLPPGA